MLVFFIKVPNRAWALRLGIQFLCYYLLQAFESGVFGAYKSYGSVF